jgi:hypothetical protein
MPLPWCYVLLPDVPGNGAQGAHPRDPRLRKAHVKRHNDFKSQRRSANGENHKLR